MFIGVSVSKRALIVEDDELLREPLGFLLKSLGLEVEAAEGMEQAKKALDSGRDFHIILSDLNLGDGKGLQLFEWLRTHKNNHNKWAHLILMTGFADEFDSEKAHGLKVAGFVPKPFEPSHLRSMLESYLKIDLDQAA